MILSQAFVTRFRNAPVPLPVRSLPLRCCCVFSWPSHIFTSFRARFAHSAAKFCRRFSRVRDFSRCFRFELIELENGTYVYGVKNPLQHTYHFGSLWQQVDLHWFGWTRTKQLTVITAQGYLADTNTFLRKLHLDVAQG